MPSLDLSASPPSLLPAGLGSITALVLAGGRGMRMGGVDKGLQSFRGQSLAQHAFKRLAAQTGGPLQGVLVNANRNVEHYRAQADACFGAGQAVVFGDKVQDYAGPLAGIEAGLALCRGALLLTVPCDSPLFPLDLASRLYSALVTTDADIAVVQAPEAGPDGHTSLRSQPVFCLLRVSLQQGLTDFLAAGGRKIDVWTAQHRVVGVPFNTAADDAGAFANANTLDELRSLENP